MNQEAGSLTTGWRRMLFPAKARQFRGQRWFDIGLRSIHLVGINLSCFTLLEYCRNGAVYCLS